MNSQSQEEDGIIEIDPSQKEELFEKIRQFDAKLNLDKDKFKLDKQKHKDDVQLRNKQINKQTVRQSAK